MPQKPVGERTYSRSPRFFSIMEGELVRHGEADPGWWWRQLWVPTAAVTERADASVFDAAASANGLRFQAFEQHLGETGNHAKRLEDVFRIHGVEPKAIDCPRP
jgi:hypothetical protein